MIATHFDDLYLLHVRVYFMNVHNLCGYIPLHGMIIPTCRQPTSCSSTTFVIIKYFMSLSYLRAHSVLHVLNPSLCPAFTSWSNFTFMAEVHFMLTYYLG